MLVKRTAFRPYAHTTTNREEHFTCHVQKAQKNNEVIGYYIPKTKYSFTAEQMKQIEDCHDYIFKFLRCEKLDYREYYDVVVFSFLSGIQDYDPNHPKVNMYGFLRLKMRRAVTQHKKYMNVNSRCALKDYIHFRTEGEDDENDTFSFYDVDRFNLAQHIEMHHLFDQILSGDLFDPIQTDYIKYIMCGCSGQEATRKIARKTKIKHSELKNRIQIMRIMLKSYVRYGI